MDYQVIWSPEVAEDIDSIVEYISQDSLFYAQSIVLKILETSRSIKKFPLIGRIVPEIGNENIREIFIYSYRLVYQLKNETIFIVAVIHGKRLLKDIRERF